MSRFFRLSDTDALRKVKDRIGRTHKLDEEAKPKRAKYSNKKFDHADGNFDSKRELSRWLELKLLQSAGKISNLRRQVDYVLLPPARIQGKAHRAIVYRADFVYIAAGETLETVEDKKGFRTRLYQLKRRLMKHVHNIEVLET